MYSTLISIDPYSTVPMLFCAGHRHGGEVIAVQANFSYGAQVFVEIEEIISSYQVGILGDWGTLKRIPFFN